MPRDSYDSGSKSPGERLGDLEDSLTLFKAKNEEEHKDMLKILTDLRIEFGKQSTKVALLTGAGAALVGWLLNKVV